MKLKNKKTGEIREIKNILVDEMFTVNSLAELNAVWEDVSEEPKDNNYWYIDDSGRIRFSSEVLDEIEGHSNNGMIRKSFGNYFETKEEAELAVRKLKAWKRLKDNGFRFQFWASSYEGDNISFFIDWINADSKKEIEDDLDLLFGGEN